MPLRPLPESDGGDIGTCDTSGVAESLCSLAGLVLWLDPANGVTTSPTFVWPDRSAARNDAVALPANSPTVRPATADLPPRIELSGLDQFLSLPPGMEDFTQGLTLFVVAEPKPPLPATASDAARFIDFATSYGLLDDAILLARIGGSAAHNLLYQAYMASRYPPSYPALSVVADDSLQLLEVAAMGGNAGTLVPFRYFKNGIEVGSGGTSYVPRVVTRGSVLIGRSNYLDSFTPPGQVTNADYHGMLGDIVLYNRLLSDDERRAVEGYLLDRWHLR